jgi:hypothetical protein
MDPLPVEGTRSKSSHRHAEHRVTGGANSLLQLPHRRIISAASVHSAYRSLQLGTLSEFHSCITALDVMVADSFGFQGRVSGADTRRSNGPGYTCFRIRPGQGGAGSLAGTVQWE